MRIIPVIDLKDGVVVHAVAGRREKYRPIRSLLTASSQPIDVARAFRGQLGLTDIYVADLNAIAGMPPSCEVYAEISSLGMQLWVDAGIGDVSSGEPIASSSANTIVLGLETLAGPSTLEKAGSEWGWERIVFSLDMKNGQPLGDRMAWSHADASSIAARAIESGIHRLLVLDLTRVGISEGTGTEDFCARLIAANPGIEITAGGGIRDATDLRRLHDIGVHSVLVASALHDGRLTRGDLILHG